MTALTDTELMAWLERTSMGWRALVEREPQIMALPCGIMETGTLAQLLQHIVAVELRYAERLTIYPRRSTQSCRMTQRRQSMQRMTGLWR